MRKKKDEYNYLIPDNYQENREEKLDLRTSSSAIGFSLLAYVCADELEFITTDEAVEAIRNILNTVDSLKKWHGHLYNWYDIKTKKVLQPFFVSTVDSGNLVASYIVTKSFAEKASELSKNLGSINTSYELQLKGIQAQANALEIQTGKINAVSTEFEKLHTAVTASSKNMDAYKQMTDQLAKNVSDLNNVYGNMLNAIKA